MGMDVYGKKPLSAKGEYFRNNVWWWRPLWDYVIEVGGEILDVNTAEYGHYNSGAGLNADGAIKLGKLLLSEIESGRTALYEQNYNKYIASLPLQECEWCDGTGIRTDAVGVDHGMPTRELDEATAIALGRTHGTCNGCNGEGKREQFDASYPFNEDNVREFAEFLLDCGGFEIY